MPALQLPRLDLSISAAQLGWFGMVLVFEKIPWCPWWTPGFWMCFFVGNVNDNVNGYVWMILDVFGCCYEHILSNVWRFFFCMVCSNTFAKKNISPPLGRRMGSPRWHMKKGRNIYDSLWWTKIRNWKIIILIRILTVIIIFNSYVSKYQSINMRKHGSIMAIQWDL